ncbi:MAG: asparaginase [Armatimonadetes bacterium]|nr:asparaginase [Armatimonadota bacterium]
MSPRPLIVLFATGGTISSLTSQDAAQGYAPALAGEDLLSRIPGHADIARVEVTDFSRVVSQDLTLDMVIGLCRQVNRTLSRPDVAGVVITHGTGTLEDTCFLADLFVRGDKPVVGTGAMFNASWPEWDGRRNILDALAAAASPESRGKGVLVCMNGEVHAARDVVKMHASSPAAFVSPGTGPLGCVDDGRVIYYRAPTRRHTFPSEAIEPEVELIKVAQGSSDRLFRAALHLGVRGVVIEGLGGRGTIPGWFFPAIREALTQGVPVVLCTRSPVGRVAFTVSASMVELGEMGVIPGGDLPAHKARLLLMAALAHTRKVEAIRSIFATVAP